MKNSTLVSVCAAFAVATGVVGQVAAASLSGGYSISGRGCTASGPGSGFLTEQSAGCSVSSGSFFVSGSGDATYDTLRATARVSMSEADPTAYTGFGSVLASATGSAEYQDSLTIDIHGRTGETVDLVFTTAMHGQLAATADAETYGQADARLRVTVNGEYVSVSRNADSTGGTAANDFNPGRVQITLGTPFSVIADLDVSARLQSNVSSATAMHSGNVLADFGGSGGITSFALFAVGTGASITDWSLTSQSGTFGFYSAVPVPASVWLLGSGLVGLIGMARRRQAA